MAAENTNILHVTFPHKGPKVGERPGANKVEFGQRK